VAGKKLLFDDVDGGAFKKSARKNEAELDITPMIDVTFLLLIFFMVTSTMQSEKDLDVPVADHGVGVDKNAASVVVIRANDGDPQILLGEDSARPGTLDEVTAFVEAGLAENREDVIVKADREVPHGFVQEGSKKAAAVEGIRFSIGVRDKDK
jgi:biopolymer transport protein TolR